MLGSALQLARLSVAKAKLKSKGFEVRQPHGLTAVVATAELAKES
jgi:hypothetical protein